MMNNLKDEKDGQDEEENFLEALAFEGKNQDTEKLIKALHNI